MATAHRLLTPGPAAALPKQGGITLSNDTWTLFPFNCKFVNVKPMYRESQFTQRSGGASLLQCLPQETTWLLKKNPPRKPYGRNFSFAQEGY